MSIPRRIKWLLPVLFFVACSPEEMTADYGTLVIYKLSSTGSFSVYINGTFYGDVPYVDHVPACNTSDGLRLKMVPGTFYLDVRNNSNTTYVPPVQTTIAKNECLLVRAQ